jgi:hypothetical protein
MTKLASQFVKEGLSRSGGPNIIDEVPVASDPCYRTKHQDH